MTWVLIFISCRGERTKTTDVLLRNEVIEFHLDLNKVHCTQWRETFNAFWTLINILPAECVGQWVIENPIVGYSRIAVLLLVRLFFIDHPKSGRRVQPFFRKAKWQHPLVCMGHNMQRPTAVAAPLHFLAEMHLWFFCVLLSAHL